MSAGELPSNLARATLQSLPYAVIVLDGRGKTVWWNTACAGLSGRADAGAVAGGGPLDPALEELATSVARGGVYTSRANLLCRDGTTRPVEASSRRLPSGEIVVSVRDRGEEERETALRRAVYEIAEAAAGSGDLIELFRRIHRIIASLMYAPNLYFSLYDEQTATLSFPYFVNEKHAAPGDGSRPLAHGLTEHLIRTRRALLLDRAAMERLAAQGEIDPVAFLSSSWVGVPLRVGESTVGTVAIQSYHRDRQYTLEDQAMLEFVSRQAAMAIHTRRAEERRARLEERLRQADKMESVGRLAGGVAHGLNNLLVPVLGYAELIAERPGSPEIHDMALEIRRSAERARALVDQLLAFSRRRMIQPSTVDLRTVVGQLEASLRGTLRPEIALRVLPGERPAPVSVDRALLDQVLMHLALNAQDAMRGGGLLTVRVDLDTIEGHGTLSLEPGPYAVLTLADTGIGMDETTRGSIFEPFFTTKQVGQGSGLGLSTAYGIVRQHGGDIEVESAPGRGSLFRVYLPCVDDAAAEAAQRAASPVGTETILLVQESLGVRELTLSILSRAGYTVLPTSSPAECLEAARARRGPIHLVIADPQLQGVSGRELVQKLRRERPGLRALFTASPADLSTPEGVPEGWVGYVTRPFGPSALRKAVRDILDRSAG